MSTSLNELVDFKEIEKVIGAKKDNYLKQYSNGKKLATLIIGFRLDESDERRSKNLLFILEWLKHYYHGVFDILLVEQDKEKKLRQEEYSNYDDVRYEFIYNPENYNRGWGYNVAVKHFCSNSKVVVLMDTDVLTGANFLSAVRDCYIGKYDVVSPYQNIYYTTEPEADAIVDSKHYNNLQDVSQLKNPVTITGGIVIFNRDFYMSINGFEQYIGYGCEDRALDVTVLNFAEEHKVKIFKAAYVHMWHEVDRKARKNWDGIYNHLKSNYKCIWDKNLKANDYIHSSCNHQSKEENIKLILKKSIDFASLDLYSSELPLTPNGLIEVKDYELSDKVIIPPEITTFKGYEQREIYNTKPADSSELEQFRNAFLGKRCFIIGNGPSLNKHDLSLLENEYTFGVNSFYYKTRETGFRPFFYVVEDSSVMKENIEEIKDYYAPFKFFPTLYKNIHPKEPNTFFFQMNRGFYEKSSPNYAVPRFSTDITKELFCGQSVTYINLQLAYFMGFTEVYLIGMDFDYIIPESHSRNGDVLLSDTDDENHFHKDYFGKGKTWKDPKLERVGNNYKMAKVVYESVGRKIYNATVGGKLDIFDRIDYPKLFDEGDDSEILQPGSFKTANDMFRNKEFNNALYLYIRLAESVSDFHIYKEQAVLCYLKAIKSGAVISDDFRSKIINWM